MTINESHLLTFYFSFHVYTRWAGKQWLGSASSTTMAKSKARLKPSPEQKKKKKSPLVEPWYWIYSKLYRNCQPRWNQICIDTNQEVQQLIADIGLKAMLYKPKNSIPNDESGDNAIRNLSISQFGPLLCPSAKISDYFGSKPSPEILHFIVGLWNS